MELTIVLLITGIILGAIASFLIGRYFFKQSEKKKALSPYLQFATRVFSRIDPELKNKLKISYENTQIDNLVHAQFVIANTGNKPIRDCLRPLTLEIEKELEILNVNIIHIFPEGREVKACVETTKVVFEFPLLDVGEYFVVKFLFKTVDVEYKNKEEGKERSIVDNFNFKITVDELPPKIEIERLPFDYIKTYSRKKDWSTVWVTLFILLITISQSLALYKFIDFDTTYFLFNFKQFFSNFSFYHFFILISWLSIIAEIILMIALISIAKDEIISPKKPKFSLPEKLFNSYSDVYYEE